MQLPTETHTQIQQLILLKTKLDTCLKEMKVLALPSAKKELRAIAKEKGVKGYYKMNKAQLIAALS